MQKSRANLARIAARAAASTSNDRSLSRFPLDSPTATGPVGFEGVRRHGNKRSGKGGSSTGGCNGMWRTVSQSYRDSVIVDNKWDRTVSTHG